MAKSNKKYLIKGLRKSAGLESASKIMLDDKLKNVFIRVDLFLEDDSEKNLHQLRIALRRFRYLMESLYLCIDDKLFTSVRKKTKDMLDLLGEGRDQDVLTIKLKEIFEDKKFTVSKELRAHLKEKRIETRQMIKVELIKYICDENLNKFFRKNKLGGIK